MNALIISFSGRKETGNCSKIVTYACDYLSSYDINVSSLAMKDLNIKPCSGCRYECFESIPSCPHNDDLYPVYDSIMKTDVTLMVIPVYSSAPPALYFSWRERSQSVFLDEATYEKYSKVKKAFIIVGNKKSGASQAINIIESYHENIVADRDILLLQSNNYGQKAVLGKLIDVPQVQEELKGFLTEIFSLHT